MANKKIQLKVVNQPQSNNTKIIEISPPEILIFRGHGSSNFLCGKCNTVLADSIDEQSLHNMVLKCNKCQSLNQVPYHGSRRSA